MELVTVRAGVPSPVIGLVFERVPMDVEGDLGEFDGVDWAW